MSRWLIVGLLMVAFVIGFVVHLQTGWFGGVVDKVDQSGAATKEREVLYWVAPMDSKFRRDQAGKSPMGMDLIPVYADQQRGSGDGTVTISPTVEQNLGVRTAVVQRGPLWRRMTASGRVSFDETAISHVSVRAAGWIEQLAVSAEGEAVSKGQTLFELYAPSLVSAQREFLSASKRGNQTIIAAARENLLALGMTDADLARLASRGRPLQRIRVVAPRDGIVASLKVGEGMPAGPNAAIMSIADLSTVWVIAQHYEQQAQWLSPAQPAEVSLTALPGQRFEAVVDYVYPVLNGETRTVRSRLHLDNPESQLKPGMLADVVVFGGPQQDVLSVPRESLIRSGNMDRVVVALGDGRFRSQQVIAGMESGDWIEIRGGIEAGDRVVTSAQFMLDSEASISGSIQRLSPQHQPVERRDD